MSHDDDHALRPRIKKFFQCPNALAHAAVAFGNYWAEVATEQLPDEAELPPGPFCTPPSRVLLQCRKQLCNSSACSERSHTDHSVPKHTPRHDATSARRGAHGRLGRTRGSNRAQGILSASPNSAGLCRMHSPAPVAGLSTLAGACTVRSHASDSHGRAREPPRAWKSQ